MERACSQSFSLLTSNCFQVASPPFPTMTRGRRCSKRTPDIRLFASGKDRRDTGMYAAAIDGSRTPAGATPIRFRALRRSVTTWRSIRRRSIASSATSRRNRSLAGYYGGWVTPEIVGPMKGEPGSEGWSGSPGKPRILRIRPWIGAAKISKEFKRPVGDAVSVWSVGPHGIVGVHRNARPSPACPTTWFSSLLPRPEACVTPLGVPRSRITGRFPYLPIFRLLANGQAGREACPPILLRPLTVTAGL